MAERQIIQHLRTNDLNVKPNSNDIEYGEIAINYKKDNERLFIKNDNNEIVEFTDKKYVDNAINGKQDEITDLETIRSNASKGATALQSIPAEYVTDSELNSKGYLTSYTEQYQGTVEAVDTTEIVDDVSNDFVTSEQLDARGYATEIFVSEKIAEASIGGTGSDMTNYYTKEQIDNKGYLTSVPSEYVTETELNNKGYLTSVPSEYVTETELNSKGYATIANVNQQISNLQNEDKSLSSRITKLENNSIIDARASVLWLGTSIPAGDISIDPQQNNTYPKMVADALGFELYNMAKAGSFVAWYPQAPAWTTSAQVAAEFATAYSLSATRQEIYDKYYSVLETIRQNEGLSTTWRDDYLNDFMDSSFETRIIPYIDGTIAKCDGVVIDHGFNDRGNIFNVCNQHVTADKDSISVWGPGSGADGVEYPVIGGNAGWYWLTHLADNRYYDGEVYMNTVYAVANGLAGNDTGGMRGEYFGAMSYIIAKIQQIDPRIRIVIGNYFSQDYGAALGDGMNSFQTKYILQANQSIADYYGFPCVNTYKHTGLRNRTIRKPDGTYISDMYWFCPDGVHPSSDTTGLSNSIIASAYVAQIKGCFFKLD